MGTLTVPSSGVVCIDTMTLIYTVEVIQPYSVLLQPLWQGAHSGTIEIVCSELIILEALVGPLKSGNTALEQEYEQVLFGAGIRLVPIVQPLLREAARLRATTKLRTPDALHAATAMQSGCALFVTNDKAFKAVPGLPLVILDELIP